MQDPRFAPKLLVTSAAWFSLRGNSAHIVMKSMDFPSHMILMPPQNTTHCECILHDLPNLFRASF